MNPAINQEIQLLRDFLDQENDLGILLGSHQNLDTYAAALALYLSLTQAGKKVQVVSKKQPTVEVSNLVGIDKVRESFTGGTNKLVVALPYIKGEVEKVLFTEAPNTINFHLTAAPDRSITPFDLKDVKLMWEGGAPSALITVGVGTIDEVAAVTDPNATKIVNIDNFQGNSRFGDVVMADEGFSSLSEIVGKILKDLGLPVDADIAQNVMDGVLYATRNFTKGNTSPLAFEAVSTAMYQGAQRKTEQDQPRREQQNMGGRDQQQMGGRDNRQNNDRRDPRHGGQQPRQPRVQDNDFPAMHMQPPQSQPRQNDNRGDRRQFPPRMQNQQPQRGGGQQQFGGQSNRGGQQQFGSNPNDIEELMRKIKEENAQYQQQYNNNQRPQRNDQYPPVQDAEIIDQNQTMNAPQDMNMPSDAPMGGNDQMPQNRPMSRDAQMPQDESIPQNDYQAPQNNDDIPDDWLMPKVFKSSKNNN